MGVANGREGKGKDGNEPSQFKPTKNASKVTHSRMLIYKCPWEKWGAA